MGIGSELHPGRVAPLFAEDGPASRNAGPRGSDQIPLLQSSGSKPLQNYSLNGCILAWLYHIQLQEKGIDIPPAIPPSVSYRCDLLTAGPMHDHTSDQSGCQTSANQAL